MRANDMSGTDSTIYAGQPYNLPGAADYAAAEADGGQQGQATLNADNERQLAQLQPVSVSADYLALSSAAPAASSAPTGGFLTENQASADAYWSSVQDNAVSQRSFLKYAGAGIMRTLADVGYGVAQTAVAMYNQPGSAMEGAGKAIVNFGPSAFNAATDLAKESANGLTLLAEQTPFVPSGEFAGFRTSEPYNIPLLAPYSNQAEVGGAFLANIALAGAADAFGDVGLRSPVTIDQSVPFAFGQSGAASFRLQSPIAPTSMEGPVLIKAPPGATADEIAQVQQYVDLSNEALDAGALSPTGRVSTAGQLRQQASAAAAEERAQAAAAGNPYAGQVGHVPDTTWTGTPQPYTWLDLSPRVNMSLGGQAVQYPIGYQPTEFIFVPGE